MRKTPTTIASIGLALAVMLSAAGLLNSRAQTETKSPTSGSPRLLLVAGKHLASPYDMRTDAYRRFANRTGRFLTESKSKLRWDN